MNLEIYHEPVRSVLCCHISCVLPSAFASRCPHSYGPSSPPCPLWACCFQTLFSWSFQSRTCDLVATVWLLLTADFFSCFFKFVRLRFYRDFSSSKKRVPHECSFIINVQMLRESIMVISPKGPPSPQNDTILCHQTWMAEIVLERRLGDRGSPFHSAPCFSFFRFFRYLQVE